LALSVFRNATVSGSQEELLFIFNFSPDSAGFFNLGSKFFDAGDDAALFGQRWQREFNF
jgi:hypothetical protein